jgi:hypothetical protein
MIIQLEARESKSNEFFDLVMYNRSFYANDYKNFITETKKYIANHKENIVSINIKVYNRLVFYNGKNEIPTVELSGEGNINLRDKTYTVKEYDRICNIVVNEDEFYYTIIEWAKNPIGGLVL